jgi:N6-adenosine-specific RNA methylase IME4
MEVMQSHELANLFPMMSDEEFTALVEDMRCNGYDTNSPIVAYEGKILDGRNRWKASQVVGVTPPIIEFNHGGDPLVFVIQKNLHRRHLNETQRAGVAKRIANISHGGDRRSEQAANLPLGKVTQSKAAELMNVSDRTLRTYRAVAEAAPELVPLMDSGKMSANKAWTETRKMENKRALESIEVQEAKALEGVYDVIVIDPPWQMEKIEREERPNQTEFDYPTMSLTEISSMGIPASDNCHVWLWTTQKFLPHALGIFAAWKVDYVCTFVWHKPGGFQVVGLPQYNCEFVLYGRVGSPMFIDTKAFSTCFNAPRGKHSEKPEEFYNTVRRVTAGRRLDMFNRRKIEGFYGWGKEAK